MNDFGPCAVTVPDDGLQPVPVLAAGRVRGRSITALRARTDAWSLSQTTSGENRTAIGLWVLPYKLGVTVGVTPVPGTLRAKITERSMPPTPSSSLAAT